MSQRARRPQIHKFGGASLADATAVRHAVALIVSHRAEPTVVVLSAMAGVTDALLDIAKRAVVGDVAGALRESARLRAACGCRARGAARREPARGGRARDRRILPGARHARARTRRGARAHAAHHGSHRGARGTIERDARRRGTARRAREGALRRRDEASSTPTMRSARRRPISRPPIARRAP